MDTFFLSTSSRDQRTKNRKSKIVRGSGYLGVVEKISENLVYSGFCFVRKIFIVYCNGVDLCEGFLDMLRKDINCILDFGHKRDEGGGSGANNDYNKGVQLPAKRCDVIDK